MTSLLDRFFPPLSAAYNGWNDERWWNSAGVMTNAGVSVTPETALKISAYFSCLKVLGETVLSAPLPIYRRLPNGDREPAPEHPLWPVLNGDDVNDEQTSGEWLETHTVTTASRGTSYSTIESGDRGPITNLNFKRFEDVRLERLPSGTLRYQVRDAAGGTWQPYNADQVFRFPGLSSDGITGLSVLEHARESLGISLALQNHAGSTFRQGLRPGGVLEFPGDFKDQDTAERLRRQWAEVYGGSANAGKTLILENGMTYKQMVLTNEDIQMLGSEQWQVTDIARWFRMPLIMIGEQSATSNWGTGVEQYQVGFVAFTMLPWFIRFETRINKQLIRPLGGDYFCEFTIEGLLRGDVKTRFEAYQIAAGGNAPWMARNEVRRKENLNRGPVELDDFLQPMNMGPAGMVPQPRGTVGNGNAAKSDPRLKGYASVIAREIVHKETERLKYAAKRYADDGEGFAAEVGNFYEKLGLELTDRCYLSAETASSYATAARERALLGVKEAESWQAEKTEELLGLMLGAEVG